MAIFKGAGVAIVTPMHEDGKVNYEKLEELDQLDIKIFRFEKMETCYDQLNEEEQAEEKRNILNGLNFARKVIATQECDFLVLDEILGLLDKHIATVDMVTELLKQKDESMHIILTGNRVDQGLLDYVDRVTTITTLERDKMPLV